VTSRILALLLLGLAAAATLRPYAVAALRKEPAAAQILKSATEVVTVDAQVLEKKTGRPVDSLTRDDFEVYEDGTRQQVTYFSQDTLPLSVVLLFDLTDSVRPVLKPLANGALDALQHLKPEDEVAVMVYAASAQLLQNFTTDRTLAVGAIKRASEMKSKEAAFFNEGVFQASAEAAKTKIPNSRRVIIWLTDNVPNFPSEEIRQRYGKSVAAGSLHTEKDAMRELFDTDTSVTALLERSALSDFSTATINENPLYAPARSMYPPGDVYKYADETGGQVMKASRAEVSGKLANLIGAIRTRYTLAYAPNVNRPDGHFCTIKLKLTSGLEKREGKLVIRAKRGYYRHPSASRSASLPPAL
jgi:VWFA-related protein